MFSGNAWPLWRLQGIDNAAEVWARMVSQPLGPSLPMRPGSRCGVHHLTVTLLLSRVSPFHGSFFNLQILAGKRLQAVSGDSSLCFINHTVTQ